MMSNGNHVNIPIIPYGLRQEETIVQIANALEDIDFVITDVFEQIEKNIQKHKQYLTMLQKRSEILAAKVEKLVGKNVTTTIYSHYKFPSQNHSFDTLFKMELQIPKQKLKVPIRSKFQHSKYNKTLSKLHFFHVKSNNEMPHNPALILEQGLGDISPYLESADSLVLFNTNVNLYSKYMMIDPLAVDVSKLPVPVEKNKTDIAAAPNSITNSEVFRSEDYFDCFYRPAFEKVPGIIAPTDLPDLPGIAADLKFDVSIETPIAPLKKHQQIDRSKSIENMISDLPDISDSEINIPNRKVSESGNINEEADTLSGMSSNIETNVVSQPPPPFPPPLPMTVPPPPPPMPVKELNKDDNVDAIVFNNTIPTAKIASSNENMHASLMEAIRKAGGKEKAKLRRVDETKEVVPATSKESNEDLFMTDLYAALARRRKGISGQNKVDKNLSMMDRVSAMITPATPDDSDNNSDEDGNDWDE